MSIRVNQSVNINTSYPAYGRNPSATTSSNPRPPPPPSPTLPPYRPGPRNPPPPYHVRYAFPSSSPSPSSADYLQLRIERTEDALRKAHARERYLERKEEVVEKELRMVERVSATLVEKLRAAEKDLRRVERANARLVEENGKLRGGRKMERGSWVRQGAYRRSEERWAVRL